MKIIIFFSILIITLNYSHSEPKINPAKFKIINPGLSLNTKYMDYAPAVTQDGKMLFFVSDRDGSRKSDPGTNSHDIYFALKRYANDTNFLIVAPIEPPESNIGLNTIANEGAFSISQDNKRIYFTACHRQVGYGNCDLYVADVSISPDTIKILNIANLGPNINTRYFESQPSISPDNLRLYFATNRPVKNLGPQDDNSNRGLDYVNIAYSDYDTVLNIWTLAKCLNKRINTDEADVGPYICADNKTLIFSSKGHRPNYGGYDYYYSVRDSSDNWSEPVNLGEQINTDEDDFMITTNGTGDIVYISSDRDDLPNYQGKLDISMITGVELFEEANIISWQQDKLANIFIEIFNDNNVQVRALNLGNYKSGRHNILWDCKNSSGQKCPPGIYYYELRQNDEIPEPPRVLKIK